MTRQQVEHRPRGRVGMRMVAEEAGVSTATVSNVLNRPQVVSEELQDRVRAAMRKLGFVPNAAARSLRSGTSHAIGAVFFDLANPFFAKVARYMSHVASARGHTLHVMSTDQDMARESAAFDFLIEHGIRGAAVTTSFPDLEPLLELQQRGVSVLLLAQESDNEEIGSVSVDDRYAMAGLARHVLSTGRRKFGFIDGPPHARQHVQRRRAVIEVLTGAGLDLRTHLVEVQASAPDIDGGRGAARQLLDATGGDLDAVMCINDFTAIGAMDVLCGAGLRVPEDVAVTGFDDIDVAGLLGVPLTTVRQPLLDIGTTAANLLIDAISPQGALMPRTVFRSEVIVRDSTRPTP